jgi:hypothetical protein
VCSEKEKRDEKNKKKGLDSVGIVRDARLGVSIPSAFFGQRGITPAFGYGAPHSSARGTLTLLSSTLLHAR